MNQARQNIKPNRKNPASPQLCHAACAPFLAVVQAPLPARNRLSAVVDGFAAPVTLPSLAWTPSQGYYEQGVPISWIFSEGTRMGDFWDTFVFRVCMGLNEGFFPGFRRATVVLHFAYGKAFFNVPQLTDLSILLIVLTCPTNSQLHQEAAREYLRRKLPRHQEWAVLREALAPRMTDLYLLGYFGDPRQRAVVARVVHTLYLPPLARFLARLALEDDTVARVFGTPFLNPTLTALTYDEIVRDEFLCQLYLRVLSSPWPNADQLPIHPPAWWGNTEVAERTFLECCLARLSPGERCALYLSFHAQLSAEQIACVFQPVITGLEQRHVVDWLSHAWEEVLKGMVLPSTP